MLCLATGIHNYNKQKYHISNDLHIGFHIYICIYVYIQYYFNHVKDISSHDFNNNVCIELSLYSVYMDDQNAADSK